MNYNSIKYLSVLWSILYCGFFYGQTTISGKITTTANEDLYPVSVLLTDTSGLQIRQFALTSIDGTYSMLADSIALPSLLIVRSLGYGTEKKRIEEGLFVYDFKLKEETAQLDSILVKAAAIEERGDTISYRVGAFANERDRTIGEVLAKMPGIELTPTGEVFYQGRAINRYYVDGIDLMEGRYGIINENLPHDKVATIEVLENHQPLEILDSLVVSNQAAINLKLKNNVTVTGPVELGTGVRPDAWLWQANATPMLFNRNRQAVVSYQSNNSGRRVQDQLTDFSIADMIAGRLPPVEQRNFLSVRSPILPEFKTQRWWDNRVHFVTTNFLQKLSDEKELKINASFVDDRQRIRGSTETRFILPNDTTQINEQIDNLNQTQHLLTKITYEQNDKTKFVRNSTDFNLESNTHSANIQRGLNGLISQDLTQPNYSFTNSYSSIHKLKQSKSLLNLSSIVRYQDAEEELLVQPGAFINELSGGEPGSFTRQTVNSNKWLADQSVNTTWKKSDWTFRTTVGFKYEHTAFGSVIETPDTTTTRSDFKNTQNWQKTKLYLEPSITRELKGRGGNLRFALNTSWQTVRVEDRSSGISRNQRRFIPEPSVSFYQPLSKKWIMTVSARYSVKLAEVGDSYTGFILTDYRNLGKQDVPLKENQEVFLNGGGFFKNSRKGRFGSIYLAHIRTTRNLFTGNQVLQDGSTAFFAIQEDNLLRNTSLQGKIDQRLSTLKSTLKLEAKLSQTKMDQLINGVVSPLTNHQASTSVRLDADGNEWIYVYYKGSVASHWTQVGNNNLGATLELNQLVEVTYTPTEQHFITCGVEWLRNSRRGRTSGNAVFFDLSYRYAPSNKKWELSVSADNLLNERSYRTFINADFSTIKDNFLLRGRQLMTSVRYSF